MIELNIATNALEDICVITKNENAEQRQEKLQPMILKRTRMTMETLGRTPQVTPAI